jgi:prepilin-type processing-associated H-X9-DG protein
MVKRRLRLGLLICSLAIGAGLAAWLVIWGSEILNRRKCASNLSAIGQVILLYANGHLGKYPPDLGTLAKEEDVAVEVFVCPSSRTRIPPNLSWPQSYAWVNFNSDYVYLGPDIPAGSQSRVVVAYEKLEDHHGDGINVLFQDGTVRFFAHDEALKIISQLNAQINPPSIESDGKQYYP